MDAAQFAVAVVLVGVCIGVVLVMRSPGLAGGSPRTRAARRDGLRRLGAEQGWSLAEGEEASGRTYDERLGAERVVAGECELVLQGRADEFVAESWVTHARTLGSPLTFRTHQQVIRFPCAGTPEFIVRSLPSRHELRYFPARFKGRSGFVNFHTQMLVGGEFAAVQDRIAPFVEAIHASRLWVIGLEDELVLMSTREVDAVHFQQRLALGRAITEALG
ncbi:hypothetical protein BJ980_001025 [Nocardioides daedukensis]|uniref:DUF3137 domain-containing protein n=1 Tax=Nocardioides daedukensis TaxID=634462 RepID=A0A7Y9RWS3_9ACTN|nr:hypothetical protein [Nocardioides daedukensis]NYG58102.1 hypothetical protein [Nocardioides daedukensis]